MTKRNSKSRSFFLVLAAIVITALIVSVAVLSAKRQGSKQQHPKDWLTSIPPVMSKVKDLEIINARIVNTGTDASGVAFEIWNHSSRPVMAVSITCGGPSITKDGLDDEVHPTVVIEPYGTLTAEMRDELTRDAPIVIVAATFEDGTEEGTDSFLKRMHAMRAHERARRKAEAQLGEKKPSP